MSGVEITKTCTGCKVELPLSGFPADKSGRYGVRSQCRDCVNEYQREYREANHEQLSEYQREYREANHERINERNRERAAANPERKRAYRCTHHAKNNNRTEEQIEADRSRLRPDGTKTCRKCREALTFAAFPINRSSADGLRADCRDCHGAHAKLRRVMMTHAEDNEGWRCIYCSRPFEHTDHVVPVALEGTDAPDNLHPACADCNHSKNDKHLLDWFAWLPDGHRAKPHPKVLLWLHDEYEAALADLARLPRISN